MKGLRASVALDRPGRIIVGPNLGDLRDTDLECNPELLKQFAQMRKMMGKLSRVRDPGRAMRVMQGMMQH
jgi:signal recognition particle GTPase